MQQNFLSSLGFSFKLARLPSVSFFVQSVNIPGVSIGSIDYPTPFKTLHVPGDKIEYDIFDITIKMDENLISFSEIFNWMQGLTHPDEFSQYANLERSDDGLYSDGTLLVLNSSLLPILEFHFKDMFPVNISSMNMDASVPDTTFVTSNISFKHNGFTLKKLNQ